MMSVLVLALSSVDHEFEPRLGQTKDYKIVIIIFLFLFISSFLPNEQIFFNINGKNKLRFDAMMSAFY
jgi:hypothetical protein